MPRLFYGNFDFEESLIRPPGQQRSRGLVRILAELATSWVAIVEQDDVIWCPSPVDKSFIEPLRNAGWAQFRLVSRPADIPTDCEFAPWGWTTEAIAWGESVAAQIKSPSQAVVRSVNSRQFAYEMETSLKVALPQSRAIGSLEQLLPAIEQVLLHHRGGVVKVEFSQAGREQFRIPQPNDLQHTALKNWATPRLATGQRLYVEPWLEAVAEAGIQLEIAEGGDVQCLGVAEMLLTTDGRYGGSRISTWEAERPDWDDAVTIAMDVARAAAALGYFGPLGIDAMRYRRADGSIGLRAIQDVNARWTMGRLSLGFCRFLAPNASALWIHGSGGDQIAEIASGSGPSSRIIPTSPTTIDGQAIRLATALSIDRQI